MEHNNQEVAPQTPAPQAPAPSPEPPAAIPVAQPPAQAPESPAPESEPPSTEGKDIVSIDIFKEALNKVKDEPPAAKPSETAPHTEPPPTAAPPPQKQPRDLSDIDEKDRPYFRAMSNEAFARMKELYKEYKQKQEELQKLQEQVKRMPSSIYEHPEAFILSDDYRQARANADNLVQELRYWETQYEKIAKGEDWEDVEILPDGKVKFVPRQADARSSVEVLGYITEAKRLLAENYNKINQIKQSYANTYNSVTSVIRNAEKQFFPNYEDYDNLVRSNDAAKVMHTALAELGLSKNPLSSLLVKLYTAFIDQRNKLAALQQKTPVATPVAPNPPSKTLAGGNTGSVNTVSLEEFKRALGEL